MSNDTAPANFLGVSQTQAYILAALATVLLFAYSLIVVATWRIASQRVATFILFVSHVSGVLAG
jgi:uncharacterized membrane protein